MEIEYEQEGNGRWSAEVNLNKLYANVTGGVIYAYGASPEEAKTNLLENIQEFTIKLMKIN